MGTYDSVIDFRLCILLFDLQWDLFIYYRQFLNLRYIYVYIYIYVEMHLEIKIEKLKFNLL